jgi:hypothetical protein
MHVRQLRHIVPLLTACLLLAAKLAFGQQAEDDPDRLVVKVYRVADLVLPTPNYAFRGVSLPGLRSGTTMSGIEGTGPGMGGSGAPAATGGAMGGGGGFFAVPDELSQNSAPAKPKQANSARIESDRANLRQAAPQGGGYGAGGAMGAMMNAQSAHEGSSVRFTLDDLMTAIQRSIEPGSWDTAGGMGSIYPLGNMLIISQTSRNHAHVQELLTTLRSEGAVPRSISIEAYWLLLSDEELEAISTDGKTSTGKAVKRQALTEIALTKKACRAQVTCFDGQTVHVVSGNMKSLVSSLIPVVGQVEANSGESLAGARDVKPTAAIRTAQFRSGGRDALPVQPVQLQVPQRQVGYQPVVTTVNVGTLLQVTPTMSDDSVVLDLQSVVVSGTAEQKPVEFKDVVGLDRLDIVTQQLMTTLRVPAGQAVIAGGMTLEPGENVQAAQLYLVVQADVKDQGKPATKPRSKSEQSKN